MFMRCRVTSKIILVPRSKTKEERAKEVLEAVAKVDDLVEVEDRLFATTSKNRDTTHETIPILLLHVSIASLTIILLKNALFCKLRCRTKDYRWVTKMSS